MATSKIINIGPASGYNKSQRLKNAIEYILNPEKTCDGKYVGSGNCFVENVYSEMIRTKKIAGKENDRQGYHLIISFPPGEDISEQTAFQIIQEFAEEYLGKNYEYVFTVHNDQPHMHGHIIFNSVSLTSRNKYRYVKGDWDKYICPLANKICKKYGVSQLHIDEDLKTRKKKSEEYLLKELLECRKISNSSFSFIENLKEIGYEVRIGNKYMSVIPPGKKNPIRLGKPDSIYKEFSPILLEKYFNDNISKTSDTNTIHPLPKSESKWKTLSFDPEDFYIQDKAALQLLFQKRNSKRKKRTVADRTVWKHYDEIKALNFQKDLLEYMNNQKITKVSDVHNRKNKILQLEKELNISRHQIYSERYPVKDICKLAKQLKELEKYNKAYKNGDRRFSNEHNLYENIISEIIDKGFSVEKAIRLQDNFQSQLDEITEMKSLIRKEKKMIDRLKKSDFYINAQKHEHDKQTSQDKNIEKKERRKTHE